MAHPSMADDSTLDISNTDPTATTSQRHERVGSMSLEAEPSSNGGDVSPINGEHTLPAPAPVTGPDPNAKAVHDVLRSEIGIATLLNRLKQSIASAKEFAGFLKKRSILEEEHSNGLRKLCKSTTDTIRRPEYRHGSFLQSYEEVTNIHARMAENGALFAGTLHSMHEDLLEMAANIERGRKQWKADGLAAEQRVADMEAAMRKSKTKYDSLAEDYDRARTGERQGGKIFGLKGPKSAAQHEDDLLRKVQAADGDYATKVQTAQSQRAELHSRLRPEAIHAIEELIKECDSALTMQMQKFASYNEKLLLSNGLNISPLKGAPPGSQPRSMREAIQAIDNERDLSSFVSSYASKVPPPSPEIKYQRAAVLHQPQPQAQSQSQHQPPPMAPPSQRQSDPQGSYGSRQGPPQGPPQSYNAPGPQQPYQSYGPPQMSGAVQSPQHQSHMSQQLSQGPPPPLQQHERSFSHSPSTQNFSAGSVGGPIRGQGPGHGQHYSSGSMSAAGPPQISSLPFQTSKTPPPNLEQQHQPLRQNPAQAAPPAAINANHLPPAKPVFGLSLNQLFDRDESAVPMVVYQCIQAVDLFGLEVEGIYRLSGTQSHINNLKALFDHNASMVDFRDPANFMQDVNSVAGLLKQFFRSLPDPLLTKEHYGAFIEAARNEDDIVRRDSLHAIINSLPDPNYATLRAVTLHLNRVLVNSPVNRMNANNLAIVFGPTLMGSDTGPSILDAGFQVKVIETILHNALQIFDDD